MVSPIPFVNVEAALSLAQWNEGLTPLLMEFSACSGKCVPHRDARRLTRTRRLRRRRALGAVEWTIASLGDLADGGQSFLLAPSCQAATPGKTRKRMPASKCMMVAQGTAKLEIAAQPMRASWYVDPDQSVACASDRGLAAPGIGPGPLSVCQSGLLAA